MAVPKERELGEEPLQDRQQSTPEQFRQTREQLQQMQQHAREQLQQLQEQRRQLMREHQAAMREFGRARRAPRRGAQGQQRARLWREDVVRAALAIGDREGLDGFSMRKLGRELGVDPMAAYYYFPNKAAVLDGIVDAVLAEVHPYLDPAAPWDDQLREVARAQTAALRAHPHALPVIATHPPFTEASIWQIEATAKILHDAGLSPWQALLAIETLSSFMIGAALAEVGVQPDGVANPTETEVRDRIARLPSDQFPILTAALAEWTPSAQGASFEDSLEILIAGIKVRYGDAIGTPETDTPA
jgi:TetR/AcrR family tetracycline transcriptional repressor